MKTIGTSLKLIAALGLACALTARPALAGHGSSAAEIRNAIASGSADGIASELERAERLMCHACVDMVLPLIDHEDARVRRVATWWLSRHGMRSELFILAAFRLGEPDSRKAEHAADVLGGMRHMRAIAPLGAALNNPVYDAPARAAMAAALGRIGEAAAIPALTEATHDKLAPVRAAAVAALRELRGTPEVGPALPLLLDGDESVRLQALDTIGAGRGAVMQSPNGRAIAARLAQMVNGGDLSAAARRKAAWALGEIHAPAAIAGDALIAAAANDKDASVRTLAQAALTRLAR